MNNGLLTTIVVINATVTFLLWRMMATKANRPAGLNKKAAKALWHSDPIVPHHDPPKVPGGGFSSLVSDEDKAFFCDFQEFADVMNRWLATLESRFRLQELPNGHLRLNVPPDSPVSGRSFAVYYNQTRVGRLEISPSYGENNSETPEVDTSVQIDWSRCLGFRTITEFLETIAGYVTDPNPSSDEQVAARQGIKDALTERLWDHYGISEFSRFFVNEEDIDWGELSVSFHGSAERYVTSRNVWRKTASTSKADAGRAPNS